MESRKLFVPRRNAARLTARLLPLVRTCAGLVVLALLCVGCERVDTGPSLTRRRAMPPAPRPAQRTPRVARTAIRSIELGRSVQGRPLTMDVIGYGLDRALIFGGIHGNEPTSAALARQLLEHLRAHPELAEGRTVAVLTEANPDGLRKRSRANANGVDLNRNFPASNWRRSRGTSPGHGAAAGSEPETRAIMRAVKLINPTRIVSIHSCRRGNHCNNYDGPAEHFARQMSRRNRYPVRASMGYPTPGSFGSWAGVDRGIPTITLELPRDLSAQRCWRENRDALLAFIQGGAPRTAR
jgi:protein MpaA